MADAPRYPIGTIVQMAQIPADALPRFLAELLQILAAVSRAVEAHAIVNDAFGEEVMTLGIPEWIDDDKGEAIASFTDKATGELIYSQTVKMGGAA